MEAKPTKGALLLRSLTEEIDSMYDATITLSIYSLKAFRALLKLKIEELTNFIA